MSNAPIAVTGMGLYTSLGKGAGANWQGAVRGLSGVRQIVRFPTNGLKTTIAAAIPELDHLDVSERCMVLAEAVVSEALEHAGLDVTKEIDSTLTLAAPCQELSWAQRLAAASAAGVPTYRAMTAHAAHMADPRIGEKLANGRLGCSLSRKFGLRGTPVTVNTACASGASAIQLGVEAIRRGTTPRVVAAATEGSIATEFLVRFSLLSALSTANAIPEQASKPFSRDRDGFVMGEGAAALVLEDAEFARRRGAPILGYVLGCGEAGDNFHRTRGNPSAEPVATCMRRALADAGVAFDRVGYINAHGTSTPENDRMECLGIQKVFGPELSRKIPISSNKSMIGHTISASGTIEAAFSLLTLQHGVLLPTINHHHPDPEIPLDVVPNKARDLPVDLVLSNSFGFGGQNVSLVLARAGYA